MNSVEFKSGFEQKEATEQEMNPRSRPPLPPPPPLTPPALDDYIVATEESHIVEEFLEKAFGYVGLNWKDHVAINKRYFRPAEADNLNSEVKNDENETTNHKRRLSG